MPEYGFYLVQLDDRRAAVVLLAASMGALRFWPRGNFGEMVFWVNLFFRRKIGKSEWPKTIKKGSKESNSTHIHFTQKKVPRVKLLLLKSESQTY